MNAIREIASHYLRTVGKACVSVANKIVHDPAADFDASEWSKIKNLRLAYDLAENSCVFDIGGYEGQWASDIFSMYRCTIHIFEPIPEYAENIRERFRRNGKIHVHGFGLSDHTYETLFSHEEDASSAFRRGNRRLKVKLVCLADFVSENRIRHIDLMKVNIEGGEYDLLEHVIATGLIHRVENIQVQFHDFFPDAVRRMAKIHDELTKTHYLTYQYRFVWENWRLKRGTRTS